MAPVSPPEVCVSHFRFSGAVTHSNSAFCCEHVMLVRQRMRSSEVVCGIGGVWTVVEAAGGVRTFRLNFFRMAFLLYNILLLSYTYEHL